MSVDAHLHHRYCCNVKRLNFQQHGKALRFLCCKQQQFVRTFRDRQARSPPARALMRLAICICPCTVSECTAQHFQMLWGKVQGVLAHKTDALFAKHWNYTLPPDWPASCPEWPDRWPSRDPGTAAAAHTHSCCHAEDHHSHECQA